MSESERVRLLVAAGRFRDAVEEGSRVLATAPGDVLTLCWLARAHQGLREPQWSVAAARAAVAADPSRVLAWETFTAVLFSFGTPEEGVHAAESLIRLAPNSASAWTRAAEAWSRLDKSRGEHAARRAIELAPNSDDAFNALAMNQPDGAAEQSYLAALELNPAGTAARTNLAALFNRTGRPQLASELFTGLAREDPRNRFASRNVLSIAVGRRDFRRLIALAVLLIPIGGFLLYAFATNFFAQKHLSDRETGMLFVAGVIALVGALLVRSWRRNRALERQQALLDDVVADAAGRADDLIAEVRAGRLLPEPEPGAPVGAPPRLAAVLTRRLRPYRIGCVALAAMVIVSVPTGVMYLRRFDRPAGEAFAGRVVATSDPVAEDGSRAEVVEVSFASSTGERSADLQVEGGEVYREGDHVEVVVAADRTVWIPGVVRGPTWAIVVAMMLFLGVPITTMWLLVGGLSRLRCRRVIVSVPALVTTVDYGAIIGPRITSSRSLIVTVAVRLRAPHPPRMLGLSRVKTGDRQAFAWTCWSGPVRLVQGRGRRAYLFSHHPDADRVFTVRAPRSTNEFLRWESCFRQQGRPPTGPSGVAR